VPDPPSPVDSGRKIPDPPETVQRERIRVDAKTRVQRLRIPDPLEPGQVEERKRAIDQLLLTLRLERKGKKKRGKKESEMHRVGCS